MDFIEELQQFAAKIVPIRKHLQTEEATKTSLVLPFIQLLGYDIFNPAEVVPEFTVDVGTKKGEKVDYCIKLNAQPQILIEVKNHDNPLISYDTQLFRYFSTTLAKFAILTNGIIYKFYTDLKEINKLDDASFFEFDLLNLKETSVNELKKFQKRSYNVDHLFSNAANLKYIRRVKEMFGEQFNDPSEEFVKFFSRGIYSGKITQRILGEFRPLVKNALTQYINDQLNDALKKAIESTRSSQGESIETPIVPLETKQRIETTEEELEGYHMVKFMLHEVIQSKRMGYKDTLSHLGIFLDGPHTWICRLCFNGTPKYIVIGGKSQQEARYNIENLDDLFKYKNEIVNAAKSYLTSGVSPTI